MNSGEIKRIIQEFIISDYELSVKNSLTKEKKEKYIYNEFSFQHELGVYLREKLKDKFMVQFERNIKDFGYKKGGFHKAEIDIVLLGKEENYLIELKYHSREKSRYHDTTADCVKDILFVYDIVNNYKKNIVDKNNYLRFNHGFCVTVVEDKNFYTKSNREKAFNYYCFRDIEDKFEHKVTYSGKNKQKPINDVDKLIEKGYLPIRENKHSKKNTGWMDVYNDAKYYIVEI